MYTPRLFAPGPVAVPPAVLEALARPAVHHRSPEFRAALLTVREQLAQLMRADGDDVLLVGGSGTGAFEAVLLASVPAGATVVAASAGRFGERWARMARAFRFSVVEVAAPWGEALDPDAVAQALRSHPQATAVTLTHSETSTGVLHDIEAIAGAVRAAAPEALLLVDAVTSLAAAELRPREWGLDAIVAGSQKGVMLPPGLGFVWLSNRAWSRCPRREDRVGSFSLDLHAERPRQRQGETLATPPVPLVLALDVALGTILAGPLEARWDEKARLNQAVLRGAEAVGFQPFAQRPSPAVAALLMPEGVSAKAVARALLARGVRVGAGQDALADRLLRPSVLGYVDAFDALTIVAALEAALLDLGTTVPLGDGVAAAQRVLLAPWGG